MPRHTAEYRRCSAPPRGIPRTLACWLRCSGACPPSIPARGWHTEARGGCVMCPCVGGLLEGQRVRFLKGRPFSERELRRAREGGFPGYEVEGYGRPGCCRNVVSKVPRTHQDFTIKKRSLGVKGPLYGTRKYPSLGHHDERVEGPGIRVVSVGRKDARQATVMRRG
eukprot:1752867-Rhodomonas_salina.3